MKTHTPESRERRVAARALIDSGCVAVRADEPFRLPSGWASPVYMDCRRLISYPSARKALLAQGQALLRQAGALDGVAGVAGGESSGIALAAWLSDALDMPMQYVRKRAAGHRIIEGVVPESGKVLLVDDMMAVGQSKVRFLHALSEAGAQVDVIGTTKGKGTAGVMKLHGFHGDSASHGAHRNHRKPGSIGGASTPSRVFKGMKMAGRMGVNRQTTQNLTVHAVDVEKGLVLVKGAVPGPKGGVVVVRSAAKGA